MSNLAVPSTLNYNAGVLPVSIESRSSTRIFEPVNGTTFAPNANNVIRFNINSDNLWDISHSYLAAEFENVSNESAAKNRLVLDDGVPWLSRVQIMSGGQELENISEYNRLHAFMQQCQGNPGQAAEWSTTNNHNFPSDNPQAAAVTDTSTAIAALADRALTAADGTALAAGTPIVTTAVEKKAIAVATALEVINSVNVALEGTATQGIYRHAKTTDRFTTLRGKDADVGYRNKFTYNFSIISAILSTPKLFPLIFSNLGLDVLLYLAPAIDIGVWGDAASPLSNGGYTISNCKWHCHLVDVDRAFYDTLRSQMMSTGGMLQFSGTTYKHYLETSNNDSSTHTLTIPTRVKSLNALFIRPQRQSLNNRHSTFCISVGEGCMMSEYVFRIGSMQYPQQSIKISRGDDAESINPGQLYNEIRKCNGVLNNYAHTSWLNRTTLKPGPKQIKFDQPWNADDRGLSTTDAEIQAGITAKIFIEGTTEAHGTKNVAGSVKSMFCAPFNFEGFAKVASESGLNLSDRALSCQCEIKRDPIAMIDQAGTGFDVSKSKDTIRYDIFAQADFLLFLTADGQMSTQV
jgi:hypothetical protein